MFLSAGRRFFRNGMPAMQSNLNRLAPQGLVIVGGKRTLPNGMPTFLSIDVPQSSRDFVNWFLVVCGCNLAVAVSSLDSISPVFLRVEVSAHT